MLLTSFPYLYCTIPRKIQDGKEKEQERYRKIQGSEQRKLLNSGGETETVGPGTGHSGGGPTAPGRRQLGSGQAKHDDREPQASRQGGGSPRSGARTAEAPRRNRGRNKARRATAGRKGNPPSASAGRSNSLHAGNRPGSKVLRTGARHGEHLSSRTGGPNKRVEAGCATNSNATARREDRRDKGTGQPTKRGGQRPGTGKADKRRHSYAVANTTTPQPPPQRPGATAR